MRLEDVSLSIEHLTIKGHVWVIKAFYGSCTFRTILIRNGSYKSSPNFSEVTISTLNLEREFLFLFFPLLIIIKYE